ncbi:MAG: winged helix-turn-helix transcriptional regulator [Candidatus Saccharibacteria bacterium]|nr:winged helix-turn-helix transcriptional regulator [Rhodoferax sp.]
MGKASKTHQETVPPAQVLRQFRIVFNAVRAHFSQMEKQVGLGGAQVWALSVIKDNPGIGMGGIASHMHIHQSTASNLIKVLLTKELISMTKGAEDRRSVNLTILPAGKKILSKVPGPFEGILPEALSSLEPAVLARMEKDLDQLIGLLNADESAGDIPLAEI